MICIPLAASTNGELVRLLGQAAGEPCDVHELRMDAITEPIEVEHLVTSSTRPAVVRCRSREAGGLFDGTASERRGILLRAAAAGAAYVNAEPADVPFLAGRVGGAVLIASVSDAACAPYNLLRVVDNLAALPADWIGFAVAPVLAEDSLRVFAAIAACPKPCFGHATGEDGLFTRVLGPAHGSRMVYADLGPGHGSVPGRPAARDLARLYRVGEITRSTPVYGLLGDPVAHSPGCRLHNRAFARLGLDAVFIPFRSESADDFLGTVPGSINLRGLSVDAPHKPAALKWADDAGEFARRIGAASTLTLTRRGWFARNTDCSGAFESVKNATAAAGVNLTGTQALVLGAGGTTRAVGLALTLLGCRVTVTAPDQDAAWEAASLMGWEAELWEDAMHGSWDLVANTDSAGMFSGPGEAPYPPERWREGMIAFDAVHDAGEARFLRDAAAAGCLVIDGADMRLRHAAEQFLAWTGMEMPKPVLSWRE